MAHREDQEHVVAVAGSAGATSQAGASLIGPGQVAANTTVTVPAGAAFGTDGYYYGTRFWKLRADREEAILLSAGSGDAGVAVYIEGAWRRTFTPGFAFAQYELNAKPDVTYLIAVGSTQTETTVEVGLAVSNWSVSGPWVQPPDEEIILAEGDTTSGYNNDQPYRVLENLYYEVGLSFPGNVAPRLHGFNGKYELSRAFNTSYDDYPGMDLEAQRCAFTHARREQRGGLRYWHGAGGSGENYNGPPGVCEAPFTEIHEGTGSQQFSDRPAGYYYSSSEPSGFGNLTNHHIEWRVYTTVSSLKLDLLAQILGPGAGKKLAETDTYLELTQDNPGAAHIQADESYLYYKTNGTLEPPFANMELPTCKILSIAVGADERDDGMGGLEENSPVNVTWYAARLGDLDEPGTSWGTADDGTFWAGGDGASEWTSKAQELLQYSGGPGVTYFPLSGKAMPESDFGTVANPLLTDDSNSPQVVFSCIPDYINGSEPPPDMMLRALGYSRWRTRFNQTLNYKLTVRPSRQRAVFVPASFPAEMLPTAPYVARTTASDETSVSEATRAIVGHDSDQYAMAAISSADDGTESQERSYYLAVFNKSLNLDEGVLLVDGLGGRSRFMGG